ncbi:MAG TPA: methyltransferase [Ktedonobacterales bacterium]
MSGTSEPPQPADDLRTAQSALQQLMSGYRVTQLLAVAVRLGLADHLAAGPMPAYELAAAVGAHPDALHRALRGLAAVGVFSEVTPGVFGLTPLADLLRRDHPMSMRAIIQYNAVEPYEAWTDLEYAIRTGAPAFDHHFGASHFAYMAQHPKTNDPFNRSMSENSRRSNAAVVAAYDFTSAATIVDIGGGQGALIAAILRANPTLRGVLFDQPHVVKGALPALEDAGVAERCGRVGGDFFTSSYPAGDIYTLRQVIHDWDDDQSIAILRGCAQVMPPHGRVLIIEVPIEPGATSSYGVFLDLQMLVMNGGRQRTLDEFRHLFTAAGLRLIRVIHTASDFAILEGERVE